MVTKTKKTILYIVSTLAATGPTKQLYGIINNLDRHKYEPYILTLSPEGEQSLAGMFMDANIPVESLNISRVMGMLIGDNKLKNAVQRIAPDIIHSQGIRSDGMLLKLPGEYPCCNTIRNYPFDDYVMLYGKTKGTMLAKKHINIIKRSNYPVACSRYLAERLNLNHQTNCRFIQNGIDHMQYTPVSNHQKYELRNKLGMNQTKRIFIMSGSLILRKDPITVIEAFKKANVDDIAELIVIGGGDMQAQCEIIAGQRVIIKGNITNVSEYLAASDVFVSAALSEGLPNSVLEAMGTGLPVLLSNIEPHLEIFEENMGIGQLFKTGDVDLLSALIHEYAHMAKNELKEKSNQARETLCSSFSSEIMSGRYQRLYDELS
ncbi:glycosyltransferase family 4 protein [Eubacteriales bacterium OttesenSCG-928-M02]|nr:glycosyltransferase family 4 protein [Eubacteriales bacterium OttesenSCG-928-M02]